jgi:uncharacterized phiE125 gp8 family phage protein
MFRLLPIANDPSYFEGIISLAGAKQHLRLGSGADEDAIITGYRNAAIGAVEKETNLRLGRTTGLRVRSDGFDSCGMMIPVGPVSTVEVTGIEYTDADGTGATVSAWRFGADGMLWPATGASWPSGSDMTVTFDAGFEDYERPDELVSAALLMLGHLYKTREAVNTGNIVATYPLGFQALCDMCREYR